MKILFVSDVSIHDVIGGAERVLHEQSVRLADRGHTVHILTRKLPDHVKHHENIQGVIESRYDCNQRNSFSFLRTTLKNAKQVFETLHNEFTFDCLNFHQPFTASGVIHSFLSKSIPKIYTCHSLTFEEYLSRNCRANESFKKVHNFLHVEGRKIIEKYVMKKSDGITVLSKFTEDKLRTLYGIPREKIKCIPGGVDLNKFKPSGDKTEVRKRLNLPEDKVILLTVRNLVDRMGLQNLIIALKSVVKEYPDILLLLGGEGPLRNNLRFLTDELELNNYISFLGFIAESQLPDYYRAADVFILPTKELEGFGLVTLEALASGLPVLGTPIGGTKEILGSLNSDLLFESISAESISSKIIEKSRTIRQNPQKWKEISLSCRKFVEKNYSWEKNIDFLESHFNNMSKH